MMKAKPNVIVIKTDQHRYDLLGCMGHSRIKTPNIDKLASEGTLFRNAYTVSTLCVPSRTSFFTGNYVHRTGSVNNSESCHIQADGYSLLEPLKQEGYEIGLSGKNHAFSDGYLERVFDYCEQYGHHGKEKGDIRESDRAIIEWLSREDRFPGAKDMGLGKLEGLIDGPMPFPPEECPTSRIADDALDFIDSCLERAKPFFLHYSFPDPHWPNVVCEPYNSLYDYRDVDLEASGHDWEGKPFAHFVQSRAYGFHEYTQEMTRKVVSTYWGQISFIDKAIGKLTDKLRKEGIYDDTLIVFTSDHGDFAGRYGLVAKTKAFYDSLLRVPLIIKWPGRNRPEFCGAQISNIDVMPTIMKFLGLDTREGIDGKSFLSLFEGQEEEHRKEIFAEVGSHGYPPAPVDIEGYEKYRKEREKKEGVFWFIDYTVKGRSLMIRKDNWKYCFYTGDGEEVYNLEDDPWELNNLTDEPKYQKIKENLRRRLFEWYIDDQE